MTSASKLLQEETSASISTIIIRLPPSILHSPCSTNLTLYQVISTPVDILLTGRDPVFGSLPFSVQHGGCGERGRHVILPVDTLVQNDTITNDTSKYTIAYEDDN